jgi:hypothetical protein
MALVAGATAQVGAQDQKAPQGDREPLPNLNVGPVLQTYPVRQDIRRPNQILIDAAPLPRDKAPQLEYTGQTANFSLGQTVTGATSGSTGTILADEDNGTSGWLTLTDTKGEFQEGEPLADGDGGAATAAGSLKEGVWVLDFAYKPLRLRTIEIPGQQRKTVVYLYYRIVNNTGRPRMFVPQFDLVTDDGVRYPDRVIPEAVEVVARREDINGEVIPLQGAVGMTGIVPPSTKQGIDDAVFGVAFWILDDTIAKADALSIFVRGLSDGIQITPAENEGEPKVAYKTLRLDFSRPGDELNAKEREIRPMEPPYDWIYY